MSSYLWRYYLENDVDRFQQLLDRSQPSGNRSHNHRSSAARHGPGNAGKQRAVKDVEAMAITRSTFRELDDMGRGVLHIACTEQGKIPYLTALLGHPWVDTALTDAESAWTALHRALYHGNVSAAREIIAANPNNWNLVKMKDNAGDTPFDLFAASMSGIEELLEDDMKEDKDGRSDDDDDGEDLRLEVGRSNENLKGRGEELFFWGSNKNLTLGFSDGDDRSYPERIALQRPLRLLLQQAKSRYGELPGNKDKNPKELLDARILFNPMAICDVRLAKFHSAILTEDPHSNLFMCGFGHGGRLGLGDEQNTQFTFRPLEPPLLPRKRVQSIALGIDHTVAVLEDGEVWTWGGNRWGQLGYSLERRNAKDEPVQSTPRQVFGLIKKERVIGCATSRIHSAVFTKDALYTWGKNDGQLGILDHSDSQTLVIQSVPRKVSANFLNGATISQVTAIDKATVILLDGQGVWILAGHGYSKLSFPIESFRGLPSGAMNLVTGYDSVLNSMRKITGGGNLICALSEAGDVVTVDVDSTLKERAEKGSSKVPWISQHVWSMKKRQMAVRDVDVGTDGNVILCTESGSVWKRIMRQKAKESTFAYKFERVPGLTRITTVRSNTIGAYAAIRKDADVMQKGLLVEPQSLWEEIAELLPFAGLFSGEDEDDRMDDDGASSDIYARPQWHAEAAKAIARSSFKEISKTYIEHNPARFEDCDAYICSSMVPAFELPIHKVIFARSPVLRRLFAIGSGSIGHVGTLTEEGTTSRITLDVEFMTLINLVYYMYTDTPLDLFHLPPAKAASCRTETASVGSALGLKVLSEAIGGRHHTTRSLDSDLKLALQDPRSVSTADICLDLEDGEQIYVHSLFMRTRCPLFDTLYGGGHGEQWLMGRDIEDDETHVHVDMKHVRKPIMDMVVAWLYTDYGEEGFDGIRDGVEESNVDVFLDFMLEVLGVANELMLDRFSQICQRIIGRYVNTRNAAGLLNVIGECSEREFRENCLQYICLNLETMLENHLLDELEDDLLFDLDQTVRANQERCYPHVRGDKQVEILQERYPSMAEDQAREREERVSHYVALEEEAALRAAFKASVISTSPPVAAPAPALSSTPQQSSPEKGRQRPSYQPLATFEALASSPSLKSKKSHEDIFTMDEEFPSIDKSANKGKAPATSSAGLAISLPNSPPAFGSTPRKGQLPWATPAAIFSPKVDMKNIMAQTSATSSPSTMEAHFAAAATSAAAFKKSQKERKRQQSSLPPTPVLEAKTPKTWNIDPSASAPATSLKDLLAPAVSSPTASRRTVSASHKPAPSYTPTAETASPRAPAPAATSRRHESHLKLTLQDIIDQEEAQKEFAKEFAAKRSLQEIQEEQEFLRWWETEEKKLKAGEEAPASGGKGRRPKRKGKRGGASAGPGTVPGPAPVENTETKGEGSKEIGRKPGVGRGKKRGGGRGVAGDGGRIRGGGGPDKNPRRGGSVNISA